MKARYADRTLGDRHKSTDESVAIASRKSLAKLTASRSPAVEVKKTA
ncbi:hypothetical protein [Microseira wollei]|nr:hypothetical protein [Microseira wollei]